MAASTTSDGDRASRWARRFISNVGLYPDVSHHSDVFEEIFQHDLDFVHPGLARLTAENTIVFVCFSNRSGSNLLLDTLGRIGFGCEAGDEFFNAEAVTSHVKQFGFERFEDYLEFAIKLRAVRPCVFLKIGPHQLFWLANRGILGKYFSRAQYLLTERADAIRQAVSLYIADETGTYLQRFGDVGEHRSSVEYSTAEIIARLRIVIDAASLFRFFFSMHSLSAHTVLYEELSADPSGALRRVAAILGIGEHFPMRWELLVRDQPPRIARQSDELNGIFAERFRREFAIGDLGASPSPTHVKGTSN